MSKNIKPMVDGIKATKKTAKKVVKKQVGNFNVKEVEVAEKKAEELLNSIINRNNSIAFRTYVKWIAVLLLSLATFSLASALFISLI